MAVLSSLHNVSLNLSLIVFLSPRRNLVSLYFFELPLKVGKILTQRCFTTALSNRSFLFKNLLFPSCQEILRPLFLRFLLPIMKHCILFSALWITVRSRLSMVLRSCVLSDDRLLFVFTAFMDTLLAGDRLEWLLRQVVVRYYVIITYSSSNVSSFCSESMRLDSSINNS